ncbi:hypothetical protein [Catenulispora rubra]|uniref:hypothetical protein n=1 Tax=Catenulispora rubra TaxID=280293 RepID=UPI00189283FB|nr:hypothetical protein [Catenulispora rubra]
MSLTTFLVTASLKTLGAAGGAVAKRVGEGFGKPAGDAVVEWISGHSPTAARMLKRRKPLSDADAHFLMLLMLPQVDSEPHFASLVRDWLAHLIDAEIIGPEFQMRRAESEYPPDPRIFADREVERAAIVNAAHAGGDIAKLFYLAGQPNIGKTELVRHWIHHPETEHFADGIYYVDLETLRVGGPADPDVVAARLLFQIGLLPSLIPVEPGRAIEWWRRLTRGRSLCVVFDHVTHSGEVEPLLPVAAASMALVVADEVIAELLGAHAVHREVGGFGLEAATEYFDQVLATGQLDDDHALEQVVNACAGIPAVLRIVAGILVSEPGSTMSSLARRLTDGAAKMDELRSVGAGTMRVYDEAYARLSPEAQQAYRTLGLLPDQGSAFGVAWLGEVSGLGASTRRAFLELKSRYLIRVALSGPDLSANQVIRMHARELLQGAGEYSIARQEEARVTLRRWYAITLQYADEAISRNEPLRLASVPLDRAANPFADSPAALMWVAEHEDRLVSLMNEAFLEGDDDLVIRMAEAMQTYFVNRRGKAFVEVYELAVTAAQRLENRHYEVRMRCLLSRPLREAGRLAEARGQVNAASVLVEELPASADRDEQIRDEKLKASVMEFVGLVTLDEGEPDAAYDLFQEARRRHEEIDNDRGIVLMSQLMGRARTSSGKSDQAVPILKEALKRVGELDDRLQGRLWLDLAKAQLDVGDGEGAAASAEKAVPFLRDQLMSQDMNSAKELHAQGLSLSGD